MANWTRRDVLKTGVKTGIAAAMLPSLTLAQGTPAPRERLLLDFGWRFHFGHAEDPAKDFDFGRHGAFAKSGNLIPAAGERFDDSQWQAVDLPHDWAVELPFVNDPSLTDHGFKPLGRNYPASSVGWYRRVFDLPKGDDGKRISLEFDGVFRQAMVVFNGHYLGENMSGYAPFRFDVTDFAVYGGKNVLLVRVDATMDEGWFYEGAGIYRHVWLVKTNPLHVPQWGVFARAEAHGGVAITTEIVNHSDMERNCRVTSRILDPEGKEAGIADAAITIGAWGRREVEHQIVVKSPASWSIDSPSLYRVLTSVESGGGVVDQYETTFGIRTIEFHAEKGFLLNGAILKIKGTCNHQDHAGVGAALPDRLHAYRIERLKEMRSNAYRTSHNPPAPELLDACDRLGMLVMDETRMMSASPEGLNELERMVRRDRNHPSIVIWSLGNEEPEQGKDRGAREVATMKRLVRRLDPTRPVTMAMNYGWGEGVSRVVDVQGFNYGNDKIDDFHTRFPALPEVGSEVSSALGTRGIYANDKERGYVSAYDVNKPKWGSTAEEWWKIFVESPYLAGGFVWTGFDYRGEPTPYEWPCISSHFGIMDTCGFPKDNFYYYQAWWGTRPVLHLFPHWNWEGRQGQEIEVWCHSNLARVELLLNGKSLGAKPVTRNTHLMWKVRYEPGVLEAHGYAAAAGPPAIVKRETTGAPAKVVLRPDRKRINADGEDVTIVTAEVQDKQGRVVPTASNAVGFIVEGSGRLIGVGNGDPSCHESDKQDWRSAFNGLCMAIVQASKSASDLKIEAISEGLESATLVIQCASVKARPAVS
jgi:beta-galactosidase